MDLKIRFDDDPICAKTTSVNIFLDEELMAERLNILVARTLTIPNMVMYVSSLDLI